MAPVLIARKETPGLLRRVGRYIRFRISSWRQRKHHLASNRESDPEVNRRGKLPDDDEVQLVGIWVAELYPPSSVEGLVESLDKLGWTHDTAWRGRNLRQWVQQGRHEALGWVNLGSVFSPDSHLLGAQHEQRLPPGVEGAMPHLHALTSAVTALSVLFVLEDSAASQLTATLRASYETEHRPLRKNLPWHRRPLAIIREATARHWYGHTIVGPDQRRREEASAVLTEARQDCVKWVADHLPGAFCAGDFQHRVPACQLLVTEKSDPLSAGALDARWQHALGLRSRYLAWESQDWPVARLTFPDRILDGDSRALMVVGRRSNIAPSARQSDNWALALDVDEKVRDLLVRWAFLALVDEHRRHIAEVRDVMSNATHTLRPIKRLKALRGFLAGPCLDAEVTSHAGSRLASNKALWRWGIVEFLEAEGLNIGEAPRALAENLRLGLLRHCRQLREELATLVKIVGATSNLTAAISNLRLQLGVALIGLLSAGIAALALWLALQTPPATEEGKPGEVREESLPTDIRMTPSATPP